jgi:iron complex transport system ATP-binding protein
MSITLEGVVGGHKAFSLGPIELTLKAGNLTALIGPNGCGKSTLLGLMAGVLPLQAGRISIGGLDLATTRKRLCAKRLTLLAQSPVVPPSITVEQLVHYGRAPHQNLMGMRTTQDHEIVDRALMTANISEQRNSPLAQLSGGQRQRAFIAMCLAQDTPYILLDEPTSFLDVRYQFEILELIKSLTKSGRTCVVVLHDIAQAARYADHLVVMREGQIAEQGSPKDIIRPALLQSVYGIAAHVYSDPISDTPVVTYAS